MKSHVLGDKRPGFQSTLCLCLCQPRARHLTSLDFRRGSGLHISQCLFAWALISILHDCLLLILHLVSPALYVFACKIEMLITKPWDSRRFKRRMGKCFGNANKLSSMKRLCGLRPILHRMSAKEEQTWFLAPMSLMTAFVYCLEKVSRPQHPEEALRRYPADRLNWGKKLRVQ